MKCCHPIDSKEEKDVGLYINLVLACGWSHGQRRSSQEFLQLSRPLSPFLATSVPHPHTEFIPTSSYTTFSFQPHAQHSSSRTESTPILGLLHVLILAAWPRPDMLFHTQHCHLYLYTRRQLLVPREYQQDAPGGKGRQDPLENSHTGNNNRF